MSLAKRLSIRASWPFSKTAAVAEPLKRVFVPRLPPEVIEAIIHHVVDKRTLKACSLVSTTFLGPSQKKLLSEITLCKRYGDPNPFTDFLDLLTKKPRTLTTFVTSLNLIDFEVGPTTWFLLDTGFIPRILASVPNLTHLGMHSQRKELSSAIQEALNEVCASCSLSSLSLRGMRVDLSDVLRRCLFLHEIALADVELVFDARTDQPQHSVEPQNMDLNTFCASPKLYPSPTQPTTVFSLQADINHFVFQLTRTTTPTVIDDLLHSCAWPSLARSLLILDLDIIQFHHADALQCLLDAASRTLRELRICAFDVDSLAFHIPPNIPNILFCFKFAPSLHKTSPSFVDIFQPFNRLHRHIHMSNGTSDVRIEIETTSPHSLFDRPAWEWAFLDEVLSCVKREVLVVIVLVTPGQLLDEMRLALADRVSDYLPRVRRKGVLKVMVSTTFVQK